MAERRSTPRSKSSERGKAVVNHRVGPVECRISSISTKGARLTFLAPVLLPRQFDLSFESGHHSRVKVAWQRGKLAGVRFVTPLRMTPTKQPGIFARLLGKAA